MVKSAYAKKMNCKDNIPDHVLFPTDGVPGQYGIHRLV